MNMSAAESERPTMVSDDFNITSVAIVTAQYNPEFDIPAVILLCVGMVAGMSNILTLAAFLISEQLRKNPLNVLVVVMAMYDLVYCVTVPPLEMMNSPAMTENPGLPWGACFLRMSLRAVCIYGSCFAIAALSLLRLYAVIRRHRQDGVFVPRRAVSVSILIGAGVGVARMLFNVLLLHVQPENMVLFRACRGINPLDGPAGEGSEGGKATNLDIILFLVILICVAAYFLQVVLLRAGIPKQPASIGPATALVYDQWEIASARVGVLVILAFLVSYVPSVLKFAGYTPTREKYFSFISLTSAFTMIQGFMNPFVYLLTTPLYRETLLKQARCWNKIEPMPGAAGDNNGAEISKTSQSPTNFTV